MRLTSHIAAILACSVIGSCTSVPIIKPPEYKSSQAIATGKRLNPNTGKLEFLVEYFDRDGDGNPDLMHFIRYCNGKRLSENPFLIYDLLTRSVYVDQNVDGTIDAAEHNLQIKPRIENYILACPTRI